MADHFLAKSKAFVKIRPRTKYQSEKDAEADYVAYWFDELEGHFVAVFGVERHSKNRKVKKCTLLNEVENPK